MMAKSDRDLQIVTVFESDDLVAFELAKATLDEAGVEYFVKEIRPRDLDSAPFCTRSAGSCCLRVGRKRRAN